MTENYFYPDTHEMFELYDVLEALLSKKNANIGLFEGAEVSADPSLDFLIRILFTPVEDRCSCLSMLGGKVNKEYGHMLEDIKTGTYQGLSEDQFEKKRVDRRYQKDRSANASYFKSNKIWSGSRNLGNQKTFFRSGRKRERDINVYGSVQ